MSIADKEYVRTDLICPSDMYMYLLSKFGLTMCVLNEMKMYKRDEFLEWFVYSSKWEALLIDNILYMATCSQHF